MRFMGISGRERCTKHGLQDDGNCAFCDQCPETVNYLLLGCAFRRESWFRVLETFGLQTTILETDADFVDGWLQLRNMLRNELYKGLDSLVMLVAWSLWKERNSRVFRSLSKTPALLVSKVITKCRIWLEAGCSNLDNLSVLLNSGLPCNDDAAAYRPHRSTTTLSLDLASGPGLISSGLKLVRKLMSS